MGHNYNLNREIAVLLIAINKLYKEIASLKRELNDIENDIHQQTENQLAASSV
jgi:predicted  nucleic acid-binding Zn-ribbon protein